MTRFFSIAFVISILHLFEDLALVLIGRYTELNIGIILVGVLLFGLSISAIARQPLVKKFLSK